MSERIWVLYVDDEPGLLELGKLFLEQTGLFTVDIQPSASDGLEQLRARPYDAIISDFQMTGMDGIEFLRTVRSSGNTIPFILFTGRGREEVVIHALNEGADFYLQKGGDPVAQFAELAHKVRQAVKRQQAEDALRDSEGRLLAIIDSTDDIIASYDPEVRLLAYNQAGAKIYRTLFGVELRPGLCTLDLFPESMRGFWVAHNDRALAGESFSIQFSIPDPGGREIFFESWYNPIRKGSSVVGFSTFTRDITSRKLAEDELLAAHEQLIASEEELRRQYEELTLTEQKVRESEERLTSIFSAALVGIIVIDAGTHRILQANTKALDLFGAAETAVVGRVCHSFICPAEEGLCPVTDLRQVVDSSECDLLTNNGRRVPVLKTVVQRRIGGRDVLIESFFDITGRKQAEDALAESEEKFRTFVERSTDGMLLIDTTGAILAWNPAAEKIFGIPAQEALASNIIDLQILLVVPEHRNPEYLDDLRSRFSAAFPALFERTAPLVLEVEAMHAEGHRIKVQQTLFPIQTSLGRRVGCIVRDITNRAQEQ